MKSWLIQQARNREREEVFRAAINLGQRSLLLKERKKSGKIPAGGFQRQGDLYTSKSQADLNFISARTDIHVYMLPVQK